MSLGVTRRNHGTNPLQDDLDHVLAHTQGLWEELRGKRIFITGGTGFFGCWLLESFIWANEKYSLHASATILTRDPEAFRRKVPHLAFHPAIELHTGDVRNFEFPREGFSHIIHASNEAADYVGKEDASAKVIDAIVQAAEHTLDFAWHCGAIAFLFTSSGTVYGPQPSGMMSLLETYEGLRDVSNFRFAHGEGKFVVETLCAQYAEKHSMAAKIARCFTFVGPYMPIGSNYAIGNFIRDGLRGGTINVLGDGTPYRSYMYAADLTIWLWTILIKGQSLRPYNVGSMERTSIAEIAGMVSREFSEPIEVKVAKTPEPIDERDVYIPDTMRAQNELNLRQWIPLPEAVKRTIKFFRNSGTEF